MRTTVSIDDQLFAAVKQRARARGMSISSFVETCVRVALNQQNREEKPRPFKLVTVKGELVDPDADLDRTSALLAADDEAAYR